jgi:hypothetical protein
MEDHYPRFLETTRKAIHESAPRSLTFGALIAYLRSIRHWRVCC